MKAFEVMGTINEAGELLLDDIIKLQQPSRVKVIVLVSDQVWEDISEKDWLHSASINPAFDFLNDPEEDIYTLADGKPFHD